MGSISLLEGLGKDKETGLVLNFPCCAGARPKWSKSPSFSYFSRCSSEPEPTLQRRKAFAEMRAVPDPSDTGCSSSCSSSVTEGSGRWRRPPRSYRDLDGGYACRAGVGLPVVPVVPELHLDGAVERPGAAAGEGLLFTSSKGGRHLSFVRRLNWRRRRSNMLVLWAVVRLDWYVDLAGVESSLDMQPQVGDIEGLLYTALLSIATKLAPLMWPPGRAALNHIISWWEAPPPQAGGERPVSESSF